MLKKRHITQSMIIRSITNINIVQAFILASFFLCFSFLKPKTPLPYSADKQNYCRYNSESKGQKEQKDGHDEYRRR